MVIAAPRVRLEIVPVEAILPHEIADPARLERIERRLREDGILRDPLLVGQVPDVQQFVLLDGTNRLGALRNLGVASALVQVLDYSDVHAVELRTWCHAARISMDDLLREVADVPDAELVDLHPLEAPDALREPATLAVLLSRHQRVGIRRISSHCTPRVEQLRSIVDIYESSMSRVDCDPDNIEERAATLCADTRSPTVLVAFPRFSRSQVLAMAVEGAPIPAGITRHVISTGRALRVNVPLTTLELNATAEDRAVILEEHLSNLQPRRYQEPTVLFDS